MAKMTKEIILKGNKYADCTLEQLQELWKGLMRFYEVGWCEEDNPITPYKEAYVAESPVGVVNMEQDLLRRIAVFTFGAQED